MGERIKQALDLARAGRRVTAGEQGRPPSVADGDAAPPAPIRVSAAWLEQQRLLTPETDHAVVHAYKVLRTQVLQRLREHGWRRLAVVSPGPNDGKTLTALNLGLSLVADVKQTALVVEFDLRLPSIAARFGIPPPHFGVEDVLQGNASVADASFRLEGDGLDGLGVLLARGAVRNSSELLASAATAALVAELQAVDPQRIIIFDLPPALAYDDALRFAPLVDAALVVVAEGKTRREDVRRVIDLFPKTPVIGTVLNRSADVSQSYYY